MEKRYRKKSLLLLSLSGKDSTKESRERRTDLPLLEPTCYQLGQLGEGGGEGERSEESRTGTTDTGRYSSPSPSPSPIP